MIKKKSLLVVCLLACISLPLLSIPLRLSHSSSDSTQFMILTAGTPDGYGNRIAEVELLQDAGGGNYVSRGSIDYSAYTGSDTITGRQNQTTKFVVTVWLNYTFASSPTDAKAFTRVWVTVAGEFIDQEATGGAVELDGTDYWIVEHTYTWSFPVISTYTVTLEYHAIGAAGVSSPQDLTGYAGLGEVPYFSSDEGGYWYPTDSDYAKAAGFRPLDNQGELTIACWIRPATTSGTQFIVNQYAADGQHSVIIWQSGTSIRGRIGDGTNYKDATIWGFDNTSHDYFIALTWSKSNDSGLVNLWMDMAKTQSATGIIADTDCAADLNLGRREAGDTSYIADDFRTYDVSIYFEELNRSELQTIYTAGQDFSLSGVDHIWAFNEFELGIWSNLHFSGSQVAYDGAYQWQARETWAASFASLSIAAFLFPFPIDYPELYIWLLFGVGGIVFGPIYLVKKMRSTKGIGKADILFLGLMFLVICWGIFVTGAS